MQAVRAVRCGQCGPCRRCGWCGRCGGRRAVRTCGGRHAVRAVRAAQATFCPPFPTAMSVGKPYQKSCAWELKTRSGMSNMIGHMNNKSSISKSKIRLVAAAVAVAVAVAA